MRGLCGALQSRPALRRARVAVASIIDGSVEDGGMHVQLDAVAQRTTGAMAGCPFRDAPAMAALLERSTPAIEALRARTRDMPRSTTQVAGDGETPGLYEGFDTRTDPELRHLVRDALGDVFSHVA